MDTQNTCLQCGAILLDGTDACSSCGCAISQKTDFTPDAPVSYLPPVATFVPEQHPVLYDSNQDNPNYVPHYMQPQPVVDQSVIPLEVMQCRWHWGAFGLPFFWMLSHKMFGLAAMLLLLSIASLVALGLFIKLVPLFWLASLGISIYVGLAGHKLAWKRRTYPGGLLEYWQVERAWQIGGIVMLLTPIAFSPILAAVLFPVFAQARSKARAVTCMSNEKQSALGTLMYVQDYDERFPPASQWMDTINPYLKSDESYRCPQVAPGETNPNGPFGYAMNSYLNRKNLADIKQPEAAFLMWDSNNLAKNASDPMNSIAYPLRHNIFDNISYVDGHVRGLKGDEIQAALDGMKGK